MLTQGQVGPLASTSSLAAGQQPPIRLSNMGAGVVQELHGRYYETAYRKALFNCASTSGTTTTVGLATTYTGLCLTNPINSTVNIVLNKVGYAFLVAFTAASTIGLACGYNSGAAVTQTTAVTPHSSFFNTASTPQGLVASSATLPTTPFWTHIFAAGLTGAITTEEIATGEVVDLEGSVILPPGAYAIIATSTASGASALWGSFSWEEIPI